MSQAGNSRLTSNISTIFSIALVCAAACCAVFLILVCMAYMEMQTNVNNYLAAITVSSHGPYALDLLDFPRSGEVQGCMGIMAVFSAFFMCVCAIVFHGRAKKYIKQADIFYDEAPATFVRSIETAIRENRPEAGQETRDFIIRMVRSFNDKSDADYFIKACQKEYQRSDTLKNNIKTFSAFQDAYLEEMLKLVEACEASEIDF